METSKKIVIILVIILFLISLIGSFTIFSIIENAQKPKMENMPVSSGSISMNIVRDDSRKAGNIQVEILPNNKNK
ncbi:MAG: hypothetical protein N3D84_03945 [Candidatus Woesearchaeota archaeon]|nr:hypothetical protein [Candidatus Woesearchaeota archaeon]